MQFFLTRLSPSQLLKSLIPKKQMGIVPTARQLLALGGMTCEFIVDDEERNEDAEVMTSPFLTGWERVVFALADDTEELMAEELEQEMVTRYF